MSNQLGLVEKTVYIVRTIAAHPQGIGLSDLARETSLSKATCYRILGSLEHEGWLVFDEDTRRSRLSLDLVFMLEGLKTENSVAEYTRTLLVELAESTRETSGLDRISGESVVVLAEVPGPHLIGHAPRRVPRSLNAWVTSTGQVLLAWGNPRPSRQAFEAQTAVGSSLRFSDYDDFLTELEKIRDRGYSYTRNELEEGLAAIAAPVRVGDTVPYALWVSGPAYRITPEAVPELAKHVVDAASRLQRMLELEDPNADSTPSSFASLASIGTPFQ